MFLPASSHFDRRSFCWISVRCPTPADKICGQSVTDPLLLAPSLPSFIQAGQRPSKINDDAHGNKKDGGERKRERERESWPGTKEEEERVTLSRSPVLLARSHLARWMSCAAAKNHFEMGCARGGRLEG